MGVHWPTSISRLAVIPFYLPLPINHHCLVGSCGPDRTAPVGFFPGPYPYLGITLRRTRDGLHLPVSHGASYILRELPRHTTSERFRESHRRGELSASALRGPCV